MAHKACCGKTWREGRKTWREGSILFFHLSHTVVAHSQHLQSLLGGNSPPSMHLNIESQSKSLSCVKAFILWSRYFYQVHEHPPNVVSCCTASVCTRVFSSREKLHKLLPNSQQVQLIKILKIIHFSQVDFPHSYLFIVSFM